jgi:hypothetical protein
LVYSFPVSETCSNITMNDEYSLIAANLSVPDEQLRWKSEFSTNSEWNRSKFSTSGR